MATYFLSYLLCLLIPLQLPLSIPLTLSLLLPVVLLPPLLPAKTLLKVCYGNKYAIYAYTHGPVTGSGPSVKPLKYDVAPYWLS